MIRHSMFAAALVVGAFAAGGASCEEKGAQSVAAATQALDIPGNPPRIGVAGKTGTYQIVFDNGAIVTLDRVELWFRSSAPGQPANVPFFKTYYKGGQTGEAQSALKHERIVGIFLIKEDLNTTN